VKNKIFALDVNDRKTAIKYVKELSRINAVSEQVFAIKIGLTTLLDHGLSILKEIKRISGSEIICDLKLAEIPSISGEIARKVFAAGADGLVIQGFVGEKVIDQIYECAPGLKLYLVSEMTHNDGGFTQYHLKDFADLAKKKKVFAIIGPANRPETLSEIKRRVGDDVKIVATGIYNQGGEETEAIKAGADYLIEGTLIRENLKKTLNEKKWARFFVESIVAVLIAIILISFLPVLLPLFPSIALIPVIVAACFSVANSAFRNLLIHYD
jgi:orotidine-5'-phosphate decarboxylase